MKMAKTGKVAAALLTVALLSLNVQAGVLESTLDSASYTRLSRGVIHRIGFEVRPGRVISNGIPKTVTAVWSPEGRSFSAHFKYSFQFDPGSMAGRIYAGCYQGVGAGLYSFGQGDVLGSPIAVYLFQGAHIARISPRWSFDYEWNFGLSAPWKPYDRDDNGVNWVVGSKVNAYLNANFFFNYKITPLLSAAAGVSLTHFSNGNTQFPNAGLNIVGAKVGLTYNFNRKPDVFFQQGYRSEIPHCPRHMSYDVVVFGSWRKRGTVVYNRTFILPDTYPVFGFSIAPMYNFNQNLRLGAAVDGFYDSSANLIREERFDEANNELELTFREPGLSRQIALGLSARAEFVMPYFTIGLGVGANVLHRGGDMKSVYQILSLKVELTRNTFVHVGYSLRNFKEPNFLMLGLGLRLNNKALGVYR